MEDEKKEIVETKIQDVKVGFVKKLLKVVLYIILGFFVLNSLLYAVLSIPYIQNKLITFASSELSTMLKTEVKVDEVRLSLFSKVTLKGLYVEDQAHDTLAYAKYINVKVKPIELLLNSQLRVNEVHLDNLYANITAADSISDFNFQFIVDQFASTDTTSVDTTSSPLDVIVDDIKLTNARLRYKIKSAPETPDLFNPSDVYVTDLNANVSVHSIDMENLDIHINSISAKEKSGLEISELQGHVLSKGSRLSIEDMLFAMPNSKIKPRALFFDLESKEFELDTEEVTIAPMDLVAFLPNLKYLDQNLTLKTTIKGKLPLVDASEILLSYGEEATLRGNAYISTYEDLDRADIKINVDELSATPKGLTSLARLGDEAFEKPAILDTLGRISLSAQLNGKLRSFRLISKASMRTGTVNLLADGGIDTTFTNFAVKATVNTNQFNLAPIVGHDTGVGRLSMHVDLDANQKGEGNLIAKLKGGVDSLQLMHGAVRDLPFAGYYDKHKMAFGADAKLHFGRIMAGFEMTNAVKPDIKLALNLSDFDVAHFYKNKLWTKPMLDFKIRGEINKLDIDNLNADIKIKDLKFVDKDFDYQPGEISLKAWQDPELEKHIQLQSTIMSANIKGDYKFSTLADEFSDLMHHYLSNVFPEHHHTAVNKNDFTFNFKLNNTEELGYIFDLPINIIKPLTIDGVVDTKQRKINIEGRLPHANSGSMDIKGMKLDVVNLDSAFNINLNTDLHMNKDKYDLALLIKGSDNFMQSTITMHADSAEIKMNGRLDATGKFELDEKKNLVSLFEIIPSDIKIGSFVLNVLPAHISNVLGRTKVENLGLGVNKKEYLSINGFVSADKHDSLRVDFNKAQIADILQGLKVNDIYAEIDGSIMATNLLSAPELYTNDFKIKDITLYKDTLGTVNVETSWSPELSGVKLESDLTQKGKKVMNFDGYINPSQETLDLRMDIERFSLAWLKPFVEGMLSDISGDISSHFTVKGKFSEPITEGFLGFNRTKIGIDYTNVTYYISDTIDIKPDRIGFDNLELTDSQGNKGVVKARLTHRNFKNAKFNLDLHADNLMVLNTQSRTDSLFYGRLFASGTVKIEGSDKGIDLNMQLKNGKKSNLNVTIPQVAEASDYKSVVYVSIMDDVPVEDFTKNIPVRDQDIPIKVKVKLEVNPGIELGVVIDPETGDRMNIKGNGTINFGYDLTTGIMTTYGDYKVTDGAVHLNLKSIKRLDFKIKEGSKLQFIGDPMHTKFDITAFRRVRADLRTLDQSFDQDTSSPRVQVDCLLGISGDINRMNLTYDIELYDGTDDQARKMRSLVSTNEMRVKQFAYLVAMGSFYPNSGSSGAKFTDGMWSDLASSALSTGLNSVFGNMLGDNWEIGADISDQDKSVRASTSLFDNKLKLHANVGYRSDNISNTDDSFVGDFDIEYLLNSIWTLKAYSHTNNRFERQAPTTQGVGIVYTREGSSLRNLFKSFKKKRNRWRKTDKDSIKQAIDSTAINHNRPVHQNAQQSKVAINGDRREPEPIENNTQVATKQQPAIKEEDN